MPKRRTSAQLAAIAQADAILKKAEDDKIELIAKGLDESFMDLSRLLRRQWPASDDGNFATKRAALLIGEIRAAMNVLDPKSKRTKALKKEFRELMKLADINGQQLADQLIRSYEPDSPASTVSANLDVLGYVADEAYSRLLRHGDQFASDAAVIIEQGIIQGWGSRKTARAMATRLGVTKSRAEMIVRTETAKGTTRAAKERYASYGVDLVMHISTLDLRVCKFCADRSGQIFNLEGYDPILHPQCRCLTNPIKQDWIEEGLVDFEWAQTHHDEAIAKAGGANTGLSPFQKASGLSKPPKPYWNPGDKIPVREPAEFIPLPAIDPQSYLDAGEIEGVSRGGIKTLRDYAKQAQKRDKQLRQAYDGLSYADPNASTFINTDELERRRKQLKKDGVLEAIEADLPRIQAMADESKSFIRLSDTALNFVIKDGRFKSQFETASSGGAFNPHTRAEVEYSKFNVPIDTPHEYRPIYGYRAGSPTERSAATQYGRIVVELKSDVDKRTTITMGDSFQGGTTGSPLRDIQPGTVVNAIDAKVKAGDTTTADTIAQTAKNLRGLYAEVQVHGGVKLADIEKIYIPHPESMGLFDDAPNPVDPDIIKAIRAAGVKVEVLPKESINRAKKLTNWNPL